MKILLAVLLCSFTTLLSFGQDQAKIDSLYSALKTPNLHDTTRINILMDLRRETKRRDTLDVLNAECNKLYYRVIKISDNALNGTSQLSEKARKKFLESTVKARYYVGSSLLNDSLSRTIFHWNSAMEICEEHGASYLSEGAVQGLGQLYWYEVGDTVKALKYLNKYLQIWEERGDSIGIAVALDFIGNVYNVKNDKKALEYYQKALELFKGQGRNHGVARSYSNICEVYGKLGDIPNALKYFQKATEVCIEYNDSSGLRYALVVLGDMYNAQDDISKALKYYIQGLAIAEEEPDNYYISQLSVRIGNIYLKQGDLSNATKYGEKVFIEEKKYNGRLNSRWELCDAAELLNKVYRKQGRYKEALEMNDLYVLMRDSLENIEEKKEVLRVVKQLELKKQEAEMTAEQEKKAVIAEEQDKRQKVIIWSVSGGLLLIVAFAFFIVNRLRITRKQKTIIEGQKEMVEEQHNEIKDSIAYAKRIQSAILPPARIVKEYLKESFILYKPKDIVAGDFYWMEQKDGKILFAAADCTGHGVPGAMVSVVCNGSLNRSVREFGLTEPGQILDKAREIVIQEFEKSDEEVKDGMDIALCSLEGNKLLYAGANNPLWIIRNNEIIETKANKQPIGKCDNPLPFTTHSFNLEKGDALYIFSDGYVDQFGGEKGKKFKTKAFRELLLSMQDKPMEEQRLLIDEAFENWKGSIEQVDDVCVIGVSI